MAPVGLLFPESWSQTKTPLWNSRPPVLKGLYGCFFLISAAMAKAAFAAAWTAWAFSASSSASRMFASSSMMPDCFSRSSFAIILSVSFWKIDAVETTGFGAGAGGGGFASSFRPRLRREARDIHEQQPQSHGNTSHEQQLPGQLSH